MTPVLEPHREYPFSIVPGGDHESFISELINKNYSKVGAVVIQRLYGEGYLSPGSKDATEGGSGGHCVKPRKF